MSDTKSNTKIPMEELKQMLIHEQFDLHDVMQACIDLNGFVGVGVTDLNTAVEKFFKEQTGKDTKVIFMECDRHKEDDK